MNFSRGEISLLRSLASIHPVIVAFTDKYRLNPTSLSETFHVIVYTEKEEKQLIISTCVFTVQDTLCGNLFRCYCH